MDDVLMTVREVAEMLQVPPETVRYWIHVKRAPRSFKCGRHVRFRREDVMVWLEAQRNTGAA